MATVGAGALAVAGAAGVGLTRPTPSHAATRTPTTSQRGQGYTQQDEAQQQPGFVPQASSGQADAGSSGS